MKRLKGLLPYIIIIIVVVLIRTFIVTPVRVVGSSMSKTLEDGNIVLLKKYDKQYERFEIVVFNRDDDRLIKRVIGLPGEYIEYKNGVLYIDNEVVEDVKLDAITTDFPKEIIPDDHYFVMGDNREDSLDSRIIGPISKNEIIGTTSFSIFPFKSFN